MACSGTPGGCIHHQWACLQAHPLLRGGAYNFHLGKVLARQAWRWMSLVRDGPSRPCGPRPSRQAASSNVRWWCRVQSAGSTWRLGTEVASTLPAVPSTSSRPSKKGPWLRLRCPRLPQVVAGLATATPGQASKGARHHRIPCVSAPRAVVVRFGGACRGKLERTAGSTM